MSLRSHGWDRDLNPSNQSQLRKKHNVKDFESLYKFYYYGFNVRATDLQAFLGLGQLKKLDEIVKKRNRNYNLYRTLLKNDFWTPPLSTSRSYISNFAFPVISPNRQKIVEDLMQNDVAVRPLICGSLENQPFWRRKLQNPSKKPSLKNADIVDKMGLYLPNNHQITEKEVEFICDIVNRRT